MKKIYILVVMLLMSVTAFAQNGRSLYNKYSDISDEGLAAELADDVNRFIKKGQYELLMEAKDSGEVMRLYTVGDDYIVNSLVMLARSGGDTNFICIDGDMPRDQLENLIAEAAKE